MNEELPKIYIDLTIKPLERTLSNPVCATAFEYNGALFQKTDKINEIRKILPIQIAKEEIESRGLKINEVSPELITKIRGMVVINEIYDK